MPVPATTYSDPAKLKDRVELDKQKEKNRQLIQAKYSDPAVQPFRLKSLERPTNIDKVKEEIEARRQAECDFDRKNRPVVPPPKPKPGAGNVRLNSAAILREDNLYRKKQEAEAAKLRAYEAELRDSSEFDEWRERMRRVDEEAEKERLERRRVETMLADEAAKEAKLRRINGNKASAIAARQEANEGMVRRLKENAKRREVQRAVVAEVHQQRERPAQAQEEVRQSKLASAAAMREEHERHAEAIAEERRVEEERRADLIRQIRALELVPKKRVVALDPTYVPQVGVLEQMSLAELRERLQIAQLEKKAEEEKRRERIVAAKREKEEDLKGRMSRLSAMRDLAAGDAQRRAEAVRRAEAEAEAARAARLADAQAKVHAQLEAKRAARAKEEARLAAEMEQIRIKNQFLGANKEADERKAKLSQRAGAQREIIMRQSTVVDAAMAQASIAEKEVAQRRANVQKKREEHEAFLRQYEAQVAESEVVAADEQTELDASRQMLKTRLGIGYGWSPEMTTAAMARTGSFRGMTKQMGTHARVASPMADEAIATRGL
mmetsp:Transcript_16296/g.44810  ORF Transcript_16296/g.44810 Transcript_16296/m.44810 type:complete len:552 (+) Transcript_16296:1048-2703(+)|eukprot:scaffold88690_cov26-Tisochrysis_lutea.AAC.3